MTRLLLLAAVSLASSALAQAEKAAPPAPGMDMSKMGPWARKPADEKKVKKEIEEFFKKGAELEAKNDQEALVGRVDFPVYMATDDMKGAIEAKAYSKEEYIATMKPFYESAPKDVKWTHKPTITVLSDSLANVVDEFTMTAGKQKLGARNMGLLVKVDGQWKWKVMAEAGWGGMEPPKEPAKAPAAAPAPAPAPKK